MTARLSVMTVVSTVADVTGISTQDILGPRRSRPLVAARHIAMYLSRKYCPQMSFPTIGRIMGGRDHTTIMHGAAKIDRDLAAGAQLMDLRLADQALAAAQEALTSLEIDDGPDHDPLEIAGRAKTKRGASMLTLDEIQAMASMIVYIAAFGQLIDEAAIDVSGLPTNLGRAIRRVLMTHRKMETARFSSGEGAAIDELGAAIDELEAAYAEAVGEITRTRPVFKTSLNAPRKEAEHGRA